MARLEPQVVLSAVRPYQRAHPPTLLSIDHPHKLVTLPCLPSNMLATQLTLLLDNKIINNVIRTARNRRPSRRTHKRKIHLIRINIRALELLHDRLRRARLAIQVVPRLEVTHTAFSIPARNTKSAVLRRDIEALRTRDLVAGQREGEQAPSAGSGEGVVVQVESGELGVLCLEDVWGTGGGDACVGIADGGFVDHPAGVGEQLVAIGRRVASSQRLELCDR